MVTLKKGYAWAKMNALSLGAGALAFAAPVLTHADSMNSLIGNATSSFANTTGVEVDNVVTWAGDNLIKLFIGSGFAVLYALRYWIVALIIFGALVYFSFRALGFFKH